MADGRVVWKGRWTVRVEGVGLMAFGVMRVRVRWWRVVSIEWRVERKNGGGGDAVMLYILEHDVYDTHSEPGRV